MDSFDDDIMLSNIVMTKPQTQQTVKKADLKKQKYVQKIKQQRKKTVGRSDSVLSKNQLVNSINSLVNANEQALKYNKKPQNASTQKRQRKQKKPQPTTTSQNPQPKNPQAKNPQAKNPQAKNPQQKNTQQKNTQQKEKYPENQQKYPENKTGEKRRSKLEIKPKRSGERSHNKFSLGRRQQTIGKIDIKGSKATMHQVSQILPEKDLSRIQKLDNAPIQQLNLLKSLSDSLTQNNITKLTQIQTLSYASVFKRKDCIIKAATGSGKTLAYLIPLINQLISNKFIDKRQDGTTILVICPTRELCIQAQTEAMRCLKRLPFIVTGCLVGGQQTNHEKSRIRKGLPLLFATPGRLLYHLQNTKCLRLQNIKTIVFEQADRTLDMGFQDSVMKILELIEDKLDFYQVQKILVSAHFNEKVEGLITNLQMDNSQYIGFDKKATKQQKIEIELDGDGTKEQGKQDVQQVSQELHEQEINTSSNLKQQYVLITEEQKIPFMLSYIGVLPQSKIMIFVSTISEVEYIDFLLNNISYRNSNGQMTEEKIEKRRVFKIHGDLDQKLRTNTYLGFRKQKFAIMISTEVASRGLDFPDLSHIVLFDIPPTITDYGNRIGRSGRFNSAGVSLLLLHYQESDYAQKIRYYNKDKPLQNIDKDLVYDSFQGFLKKLNIRDSALHYIEGIVRSMVKEDDEKYQLARKAYVSMLRAYARLKDKHIFHVKKLNLKMLSRTFGLNSAQAQSRYNPMAKESHFETLRKKRKVENIRSLQVSQYL